MVWVIKHEICWVWIELLIKENGIGDLSGNCSSKLLKFIDFFNILGGVPVFNLPIENFSFSIFLAKETDGLSPTLPAAELLLPTLIIPLRKVPVVKTRFEHLIFKPPSKTTPLILLFVISISSTEA